ncbi:MAG: heavy-metal-associated domain-containing protein [Bacteroidota bacterium]|jgi:mercuric ion binding protein
MKKSIVILILLTVFKINAQQKENKISEVKYKVRGNCGACKKRIENAADIKGVKIATWDSKSQELTITFRKDKVSEQQIKNEILKSGHDIDSEKAPDEAYNKLPACCKFREVKCEEEK